MSPQQFSVFPRPEARNPARLQYDAGLAARQPGADI
jgi:hypothetical protein